MKTIPISRISFAKLANDGELSYMEKKMKSILSLRKAIKRHKKLFTLGS